MADSIIDALAGLEIDQVVVDRFFADGTDPNLVLTPDGCPAFLLASINGHTTAARQFISKGQHVDATSADGLTALCYASYANDLRTVKMLLEYSADVNHGDTWGETPIHMASQSGSDDVIETLIKAGARLNTINQDGATPLMIAAEKNRAATCALLIQSNADVNQSEPDGRVALMVASANGNVGAVEILLSNNADPMLVDEEGHTSLSLAQTFKHAGIETMINHALDKAMQVYIVCSAQAVQMHELRTLIEQNHASPNWENADGRTPLLLACNARQVDVASYLVRHGADVNHTDIHGVTALLCASKHGDLEIVKLLLENKAEPNLIGLTGVSAVLMATCHGNVDIVWFLVRSGADINLRDNNRCTPLDWAKHRNDQQLVHLFEEMIKRGKALHRMCNNTAATKGTDAIDRLFKDVPADLNWMDANGDTAVIRAATRGHTAYTKCLVRKGAAINHVNRYGYTALLCAAANSHAEVVAVLIENKVDLSLKVRGKSAPLLAGRRGHAKIAKMIQAATPPVSELTREERSVLAAELYGMCKALTGNRRLVDQLMKQGVLADWTDEQGLGDTPLIAACTTGRLDLVEVLLLHGADVNRPNGFGSTPLHTASENGHLGIAFLLLEHGAHVTAKDCVGKRACDRAQDNVKTMLIELRRRTVTLFDACDSAVIDDDQVLALLEDGKSNSNWTDAMGCSCLTYLSWYGHTTSVNTILDHYADVDQRNIEGLGALACASINGHLDTVKLLLRHGADVNAVNNAGDTALMCASSDPGSVFPELVVELLQHGADPSIANHDGRTALIRACNHEEQTASFLEIVSALIQSGAKLDHADNTGSTALLWACLMNNFGAVKALVQAGADVNAVNMDGSTAVICACEGDCDVVLAKYLLDHGVPPAAKDIDGFTASDYAQHAGNTAVFELCQAYVTGGSGLPSAALDAELPDTWDDRGSSPIEQHMASLKMQPTFTAYNPSRRSPPGRTPPNVDGHASSRFGMSSGSANNIASGDYRITMPPGIVGNLPGPMRTTVRFKAVPDAFTSTML